MTKLKPKDIIALTSLVLIAVMRIYGVNDGFETAAALILGYYFAHRKTGVDDGH